MDRTRDTALLKKIEALLRPRASSMTVASMTTTLRCFWVRATSIFPKNLPGSTSCYVAPLVPVLRSSLRLWLILRQHDYKHSLEIEFSMFQVTACFPVQGLSSPLVHGCILLVRSSSALRKHEKYEPYLPFLCTLSSLPDRTALFSPFLPSLPFSHPSFSLPVGRRCPQLQ